MRRRVFVLQGDAQARNCFACHDADTALPTGPIMKEDPYHFARGRLHCFQRTPPVVTRTLLSSKWIRFNAETFVDLAFAHDRTR